jgi:rhamnose transport system permease protein
MLGKLSWLRRWEGLLLLLLIAIVLFNSIQTPFYLQIGNQVNMFELRIEGVIVALIMTFIIINAEIDLSVASVMGLAGCVMAYLWQRGVPFGWDLLAGLLVGLLAGTFNGFMVTKVGLNSLIVTLAGLIGYRGLAHVLLENNSVGNFPEWYDRLGQQPLVGPFPFSMILFFILAIIAVVLLQWSGIGRYVYVIGNNKDVARYSGVNVNRLKMGLFMISGLIAAFAGLLLAARLGAMRGDTAQGTELEAITIVLLGGVSIFGGSGSIFGVLLSILIILNLRNGMGLLNVATDTQTGVIGALLILSVLVPNIFREVRDRLNRRRRVQHAHGTDEDIRRIPG